MLILFQFLLFLPFLSQASPACELSSQETYHELSCEHLTITSQHFGDDRATMTIDLHNSLSLQLTIESSQRGLDNQFRYELGNQEAPMLTASDVRHIRRTSGWIKSQNLEDNFRLMRFFENLPEGESLYPLTFRGGEIPWPIQNTSQNLGVCSELLIKERLGQH